MNEIYFKIFFIDERVGVFAVPAIKAKKIYLILILISISLMLITTTLLNLNIEADTKQLAPYFCFTGIIISLYWRCPSCQASLPIQGIIGIEHCPYCTTALYKKCPNCKKIIPETRGLGLEHCPDCSESLIK